jgi:alkylated DNA repair dioxygenase AlkB
MKAPYDHITGYLSPEFATTAFNSLWNGLGWLDVAGPRLEYYCHDFGTPYTYGRGAGERTYQPQIKTPMLELLWQQAEERCDCKFDMVFLNGYRDGNDHLGWHADDSPGQDMERPIAVVTLMEHPAEARDILFRPKPGAGIHGSASEHERLALPHGSLLHMRAGMQRAWQHRIPKAGRVVGKRISLTFRGAVL